MRREARVEDAVFVPPEIERLAEAVRGGAEPEGADRALTAFREAFRATEAGGSQRPRRRDDWRPVHGRSSARVPLRVALGTAVAGVTLGGVALAAGTGILPPDGTVEGPERRPGQHPGVDAPRTPAGTAPDGTSGATGGSLPSPAPSGPVTAHDVLPPGHLALCRAWAKENHPHQGAAFQRLVDAAGGEGTVDAYCATADSPAPTESATATPAGRGTAAPGRSKEHPEASPARRPGRGDANGGNERS
ncbi:hypothetical protein ABZY45_24320 [Streptomyces sp. NPDC006516]|uniref:hypothetical protein n=1 Tax=Streptomyces sp. NPDC006516 TaxID=3154309 RepID=UPI0033B0BE23